MGATLFNYQSECLDMYDALRIAGDKVVNQSLPGWEGYTGCSLISSVICSLHISKAILQWFRWINYDVKETVPSSVFERS